MEEQNKNIKDISIDTDTIQLDQFLKWANLVESGGEAKNLIQAGKVTVNEEVEYSRSTKLTPGDVIKIEGFEWSCRVSGD